MSKVAIIGAGCSGLAAIKSCLEGDLRPVCFERQEYIGGLWHYQEEAQQPGHSSVYKNCFINSSKEMMAFSDFPVPAHYPNIMSHTQVLSYFEQYANHFQLNDHIVFGREVVSIEKSASFNVSGEWLVTTRSSKHGNNVTTDVFQGVMVCSGHHCFPHYPLINGLRNFPGVLVHSHSYKKPESYINQNVLIVGIGNSAVDIAVDIASVARQVYISSRRGAWVIGRSGPWGYPADALANTRFLFTLPRSLLQWLVEWMANIRCKHQAFSLVPEHRALEAHPTINDELPAELLKGRIKMKSSIEIITDSGSVLFSDGSQATVDAIILATGYDYQFPFLSNDILSIDTDNEVLSPLYKFTFPIALQHPTLAIVSLLQPVGAIMPIAEMQCRWFTLLLSGAVQLPSKEIMLAHFQNKQQFIKKSFARSRRHTLETFWIEIMDEMAAEIGCKPNVFRLLFTDPSLAFACYFGPCIAAQYRLEGPHSCPKARAIIMGTMKRIRKPLKTRQRTVQRGKIGIGKKETLSLKKMISRLFFMLCFTFFVFLVFAYVF